MKFPKIGLWTSLGVALCTVGVQPAAAQATGGLEQLRQQDLQVARVGYRLATANAGYCSVLQPASGLVVHDLGQYPRALRSRVSRHFSLGAGLGISSVVSGSPAESAGLRSNDEILAVNGHIVTWGPDPYKETQATYKYSELKQKVLARELGRGSVALLIRRAGLDFTVSLHPVQACAARFQVVPSTKVNAWSDGHHVSISTGMLNKTRSDDEVALIVGHELAHNILHYSREKKSVGSRRSFLGLFGLGAASSRRREEQADRVGHRLMIAGGYDLANASSFWDRHRNTALAALTHPGQRRRVAILRESIFLNQELRARVGTRIAGR